MSRILTLSFTVICVLWVHLAYADDEEGGEQPMASQQVATVQQVAPEEAAANGEAEEEPELDLGIATPDALIAPGQVQFGFEVGYARDRSGGVTTTCWEAPVTWRVGISQRANLEFGWDGFIEEKSGGMTVRGAGDFPVGIRVGLPSENISHAIGLYAIIPSGEADFGSDGLGMAFDYAWGHENPSGDFWYGQLGVSGVNPPGQGDLDWALGYNLNVDISTGEVTVLTLSLEGESPLDPGGRSAFGAGVGLTFTLNEDPGVEFGVGIGHGLNEAGGDWSVGVGLGVRWK